MLNASVLVFLFRALAGAHTAPRRKEVAQQLLNLLRDFLPFESGVVVLGHGEEEVEAQFVEQT